MLDLLFVHWNVDPVMLHIGSFGLRWYSVLFVSGFILGWFIFRWFFRREGVTEDRLGNLMNSEIYGDVTSLPWGFVFDLRGETEPKHPTQLYEALTSLLLGVLLVSLYKFGYKKLYRGTFIGLFFIICFGSRFLIEFIKEPQVDFENDMLLNMGQILSIPFVLLGIGFLVYAYIRKQPACVVHPEETPRKKETTHYARSLS